MQVDGTGSRSVWLCASDATSKAGGDYIFYLAQPIFNHNVDPDLPSRPLRVRLAQFTIVSDTDYTGDQFAIFVPELNVGSTIAAAPQTATMPHNPLFAGVARNYQTKGATVVNDVGYEQPSEYRNVYTQSQIQQMTLSLYRRAAGTTTWVKTEADDFFIELSFA